MTVEEMTQQIDESTAAYREHMGEAVAAAGRAWKASARDGSVGYVDCTPTHAVGDGEGFRWINHPVLSDAAASLKHVYRCNWTGGSTRKATEQELIIFMCAATEESARG